MLSKLATVEPLNKGHFTSQFVLCSEVVLFLRLKWIIAWERCPEECPLLGGCPFLGGSFIRGSTSYLYHWKSPLWCRLVVTLICYKPARHLNNVGLVKWKWWLSGYFPESWIDGVASLSTEGTDCDGPLFREGIWTLFSAFLLAIVCPVMGLACLWETVDSTNDHCAVETLSLCTRNSVTCLPFRITSH